MDSRLKTACDAVLKRVTSGSPRVPGVVAMATDRKGNIYEGAAGERLLGQDAAMTADSVFAIFSRRAGWIWTPPPGPTRPRSAGCRSWTASMTAATPGCARQSAT